MSTPKKALSPTIQASSPDTSVWVSANAGTGKTYLLTQRFIRLLLNGTQPERILCLTYTKAAAQEMSARIISQLRNFARTKDNLTLKNMLQEYFEQALIPDEMTVNHARQLFADVIDNVSKLQIMTIHAFSEKLLRRYAIEAGISPHFEIAEQSTLDELWHHSYRDVMRNLPENDSIKCDVRQMMSFFSESELKELLSKKNDVTPILSKTDWADFFNISVAELEEPDATHKTFAQRFNLDAVMKEDLRFLLASVKNNMTSNDEYIEAALKEFEYKNNDEAKAQALKELVLTKEGKLRKKKQEVFTKGSRAKMDKQGINAQFISEKIQELIDLVRKALEDEERANIMAVTQGLWRLREEITSAFENQKQERALLSFDDVITKTAQVLSTTNADFIKYKLENSIDHIMVDEAQDTSPEQWQIINALNEDMFAGSGMESQTRKTKLVVGDPKQSIYRFQGAEPGMFERQHQHLTERAARISHPLKNVMLQTSFRSAQGILSAVDQTMTQSKARDGITSADVRNDRNHAFSSYMNHTAHRKDAPGQVEIYPTIYKARQEELPAWDEPLDTEPKTHPYVLLGEKIASKIKLLMKEDESLSPKDFLLLVRSRSSLYASVMNTLKHNVIPIAGEDRFKLSAHIVTQDMIELLNWLSCQDDDLALASILKSPICGCVEEDFQNIFATRETGISAWSILTQELANTQSHVPRLKRAIKRLKDIKTLSKKNITLSEFLNELFEIRNLREVYEGYLGYSARLSIEALILEAEKSNTILNYDLNVFKDHLKSLETDIKRELSSDEDAVRVMTVHGAKGLEAKVVILFDTVSQPRLNTKLRWGAWQQKGRKLGVCIPSKPISEGYAAPFEDLLKEDMKEYYRLLYVAMTRARDRLIVMAAQNKAQPKNTKENIEWPNWYQCICDAMKTEGCWHVTQPDGAEGPDVYQLKDQSIKLSPSTSRRHQQSTPCATTSSLNPAQFIKSAITAETPAKNGTLEKAFIPITQTKKQQMGVLIHALFERLTSQNAEDQDALSQLANKIVRARSLALTSDDISRAIQNVKACLKNQQIKTLMTDDRKLMEMRILLPQTEANKGIEPIIKEGRIDYVKISKSEITIIDIKTTEQIPSSPENLSETITNQLAKYKAALKIQFPHHTITTSVLWTSTATLMDVL